MSRWEKTPRCSSHGKGTRGSPPGPEKQIPKLASKMGWNMYEKHSRCARSFHLLVDNNRIQQGTIRYKRNSRDGRARPILGFPPSGSSFERTHQSTKIRMLNSAISFFKKKNNLCSFVRTSRICCLFSSVTGKKHQGSLVQGLREISMLIPESGGLADISSLMQNAQQEKRAEVES